VSSWLRSPPASRQCLRWTDPERAARDGRATVQLFAHVFREVVLTLNPMLGRLFRRRKERQKHVAGATDEIQQFLLALKGMSDEELGTAVAMAAVVRMSLREQGALPDEALGIGMPLSESQEVAVRRNVVQTALAMQSQKHAMTAGAMVWAHTLRAYHFPEVRFFGRQMWGELQRGFPHALAALKFMGDMNHQPPPLGTALATQFVPVGLEPFERTEKRPARCEASRGCAHSG
jgi:hypothetical protein